MRQGRTRRNFIKLVSIKTCWAQKNLQTETGYQPKIHKVYKVATGTQVLLCLVRKVAKQYFLLNSFVKLFLVNSSFNILFMPVWATVCLSVRRWIFFLKAAQQFCSGKGHFYEKFVLELCKGHHSKCTGHHGNCCGGSGLFQSLGSIWSLWFLELQDNL